MSEYDSPVVSCLRLLQWTAIVSEFLTKGLSRLETAYEESIDKFKEETNSRIRLL